MRAARAEREATGSLPKISETEARIVGLRLVCRGGHFAIRLLGHAAAPELAAARSAIG